MSQFLRIVPVYLLVKFLAPFFILREIFLFGEYILKIIIFIIMDIYLT